MLTRRRLAPLHREDFRFGLRDAGLRLTDTELSQLFAAFDTSGDGRVSFDEFLVALRGDLNARRRALVHAAYGKLDVTGDGVVTVEDVERLYDASRHADVVGGRKSESEVLREFMSQWESKEADGVVTKEEFEEYYKVGRGAGAAVCVCSRADACVCRMCPPPSTTTTTSRP